VTDIEHGLGKLITAVYLVIDGLYTCNGQWSCSVTV